jgi:enoyl-CoA hydratase/carnithine racemase
MLQPPVHSSQIQLAFPENHVLLLTFNRPEALNAMTPTMQSDIENILDWFDGEPSLWVVIITGAGRAFCAGADLKAWSKDQQGGNTKEQQNTAANVHGFGSISRRHVSNKPMIAAVNGGVYGGGTEIVLNCDIVVASHDAKFALPEVKRGVLAIQGAIPRLAKIAGHQLASEMLLLGNAISASEARDRFRFVNVVVPQADVVSAAIGVARQIAANSPDAVQSTKRGLILAQKHNFEEAVLTHAWSQESKRVYKGGNIKEGLRAFSEKRGPVWRDPSKL